MSGRKIAKARLGLKFCRPRKLERAKDLLKFVWVEFSSYLSPICFSGNTRDRIEDTMPRMKENGNKVLAKYSNLSQLDYAAFALTTLPPPLLLYYVPIS